MLHKMIVGVLAAAILGACSAASPLEEATPHTVPDVPITPNAYPYPGPFNPDGDSIVSPIQPTNSDINPSPLTPIPGEDELTRGVVLIDSTEIIRMESYPVQIGLLVQGNLPTPCHKLRAKVNPPDEENIIQVELWSLSDPKQMCTQVLEPFDTMIPLENFPDGKYTIQINGKPAGDFNLP